MAFAVELMTITQTGTDANSSGLSGIAGVNTINTGTKNIYNIGTLRLVINGDLTINATSGMIITSGNNPQNQIEINGTLTIDGRKTVNGVTVPTYDYGFISTATNLVTCCDNGVWRINSGGTFNLLGASIEIGSVMSNKTGSTWNIADGRVVTRREPANNTVRIRQSGALNVDGLITEGVSLDLFVAPVRLDRFEPKIVKALHGIAVVNTNNTRLEDFNPVGNKVDYDNWNTQLAFLRNPVKGTDMVLTNSTNGGKTAISKEINITTENLTGGKIENAKVYIKDTNNGSRVAIAGMPGGIDTTQDIVYFMTTDATGQTGEQEIWTGFSRGGHVITNPLGQILDLRGNTAVRGEDVFTAYFYAYGYLLAQTNYELKGAGVLTPTWVMFEDTNITEADPAVVAVYTTIDNLDELYDYFKYWKGLSSNNLEIPSITELLFTANGTELVMATDWSLRLDDSLATVADVNVANKLITLKASSLSEREQVVPIAEATAAETVKFKTLKLQGTGTLTVADTETINIDYIDAVTNASVKLLQVPTGDTLEVSTDDKATWSTTPTRYRYSATAAETLAYFRRTTVDGAVLVRPYDLANTGVENTLVMGFGAVATIDENELNNKLAAQVDSIDEVKAFAKNAADDAEQVKLTLG